jgi:hypothetical protein
MRLEHDPGVHAGQMPIAPGVDIEPLVRQLHARLHGGASEPSIRAALLQTLAREEFRQARVTAYLPLLLTRYTLESLRAAPAASDGAVR